MPEREYSLAELREHRRAESCWVCIDGLVYDITGFLASHPGGASSLLQAAGTDCSQLFHSFHAPGTLARAAAPYRVGRLAADNATAVMSGHGGEGSARVRRCTPEELAGLPSVLAMQREAEARLPSSLGPEGYIGYGSEDEESIRRNRTGYERFSLRPRVLRDVSSCSLRCSVLGKPVGGPICVAPFAGAKITHPDGELALSKAAARHGTIFAVPHYGGEPIEAVRGQAGPEARLWFQLYPVRQAGRDRLDREYCESVLRHVALSGVEALVLTVDTVNNGNREKTYKSKLWLEKVAEECGGFPVRADQALAELRAETAGA